METSTSNEVSHTMKTTRNDASTSTTESASHSEASTLTSSPSKSDAISALTSTNTNLLAPKSTALTHPSDLTSANLLASKSPAPPHPSSLTSADLLACNSAISDSSNSSGSSNSSSNPSCGDLSLKPKRQHSDALLSSKKAKFDQNLLVKYSLDDMRRLTHKLLDLGVINVSQIAGYVENEPDRENRVLCTYDKSLSWKTYNIKNQDFSFPHFMKDPIYLARGGFGTVVKCFRHGQPVAVKKVDVPDRRHWEMALRLLRELVVMKQAKKLHQQHICKIIDIFGDPSVKSPEELQHIYIVMPLYMPGALDNFSVDDPATFKTIAGHTLSALHFLHRHNIMHRDIKKENIFFDAKKNRAYLADLGQARTWHNCNMTGRGEVGTRCYLSPEILQGHEYDYRSDVYSLGQTWYEILCLTGNACLFPWGKSGGQEHIDMQRALDPIACALQRSDTETYGMWAMERWTALEEKSAEWDPALLRVIQNTLMFNPNMRATTGKLFEFPYFFAFVTEDKVMDLREVDTSSYTEIKRRIFDLQHGSCQDATPELQKMCSIAVQYFEYE